MKTRNLLLSSLGASLLAVGAAEAKTRIVLNCFFPPQHFVCRDILKGWGEQVEEATEGRVRVNMPAKSMAPAAEQLASVRGGVFDAALQFNGFVISDSVGSMVSMQPFVNTNSSFANSMAFWGTYENFVAEKDAIDGVQTMGVLVGPGADFYSLTDDPIESVADLASRKMWASPGVPAEILKKVGSAVVSGPAVQMTELIQRGVVDGFVSIPDSDTVAFNVMPYAKSVTRTKLKLYAPAFSFILSDALWSEIDPADQEAIRAVSGEAFTEMAGKTWDVAEEKADKTAAESLVEIEASDSFESELRDAASSLHQDWVSAATERGVQADEAVKHYLSIVTELGE